MGAQTSKEEQLYQQVTYGNVHGIERLRREGAGLEVGGAIAEFCLDFLCLLLHCVIYLNWGVNLGSADVRGHIFAVY